MVKFLFYPCVLVSYAVGVAATSFCETDGFGLVWQDEFDAPVLDKTSWSTDFSGNDSRVRDSLGTADNVYLENGTLVLRSQRQAIGGYQFTSGAVQTQGMRSWKGLTRACVKAMLPGGGPKGSGDGIWPAHWMMPDNKACWPSNGEIDIMEMVNGDGMTHGTYHWNPSGCGDKPLRHPSVSNETFAGADWATAYHEYAVEYSPEHVMFVFDGRVLINITRASQNHMAGLPDRNATFFDVPYYMILNTAVGGPWPKPVSADTVFPTYHRIDYVRIGQRQ